MTEQKYVYGIEAYAYSDFEYHILTHKTKISDKEFMDIIKKAQVLCKTKKYVDNNMFFDYPNNMVACLCKEFGFEAPNFPCVYIGVSSDSKCNVWTDNGVICR